MKKSTHTGICQCCGRMQMLPGGKLSKHGYTVDFGFFNGTCMGAEELPYELSCEIIKTRIIPYCHNKIENMRKAIAYLRKVLTEPKVEVMIKQPRQPFDCHTKYLPETVKLYVAKISEEVSIVSFKEAKGVEHGFWRYTNIHGVYSRDPLESANLYNNYKADRIRDNDLRMAKISLAHYEKLVADWKLKPLTPVP